jgi:micrococcal nuclease
LSILHTNSNIMVPTWKNIRRAGPTAKSAVWCNQFKPRVQYARLAPFVAGCMIMAVLGGFSLYTNYSGPQNPVMTSQQTAHFTLCGSGKRYNCVVDGDTLWLNGEKIRIKNINAPELHSPNCQSEAKLAVQATQFLRRILNTHAFMLVRHERDRYGRTLAEMRTEAGNIGDMLVNEGFAHRWQGYKQSWC